MPRSQKVLLVAPRFNGQSFWNFLDACEIFGAKIPSAPLGLITVAALLPKSWECRLINRNTEELAHADLDWADMVMTGGMLPQRPDTLHVIDLSPQRGKPVIVGGPDVTTSPEAYASADAACSARRREYSIHLSAHGIPELGEACSKRRNSRSTSPKRRSRATTC